ncbi:MAG: hypothetical protein Tsb0033_19720 [Winogradskyella sp.]
MAEWKYRIKKESQLKSWFYGKKGNREFDSFNAFYNWYRNIEKQCFYCGISEQECQEIVHKGILTSNRFPKYGNFKQGVNRGYWLEIDRKMPKEKYSKDNCVLACYFCNNDKSDVFNEEQYKLFFQDRAKFLRSLLE